MAEATTPMGSVQSETIILHAEEASVQIRKRESAQVRVETITSDVEHLVRQTIENETVEITHVPRGYFIETAPPPRFDGDLVVIPVLEERVVVERRLFLKEELHIRRIRNVADHSETVTLRRQDVLVRRTPSPNSYQDSTHTPRTPSMSDETIVAVFASADAAAAAIADLHAAHVPESAIGQHRASEAGTSGTLTGEGTTSTAWAGGADPGTGSGRQEGFWSSIFGADPGSDTGIYDRSMAAGSTVVTVKVPSEHVDSVTTILERHDPTDIEEEGRNYTAATTGTTNAGSVGTLDTATGMTGTTGATSTTGAGMAGTSTTAHGDDSKLQLAEEQIAVGKRAVNRGTARIRRYVVETPFQENVTLREETVRIERRPVTDGRPVTDADFTDKVVEMTETDEEAVVSKTARVVEEVGIHKDVSERTETVHDTIRRDEVEIEQPGAVPGAASGAVKNPATHPKTIVPETTKR